MDEIRLYGLIGYPVSHSYSPAMHNAAFKQLGINAEYVLFPVQPEKFKEGFANIIARGASGLNVTIPYKERMMEYLDKISESAKLIGAVNTVVVKNGKLFGENTDGKGFVKSFKLVTGKTPKGKNIFMFGAGGAAKSVGFEMAFSGARSLVIYDIFEDKAKALACRIAKNTSSFVKAVSSKDKEAMAEEILKADVLINASPCGMKKDDPKLLDKKLLHKGLVVCDVIYNPPETPLLKDAKRMGLKTMNGLGMLLYQGAAAFKFWTARQAPVGVMKKALEAQITRLHK